MEHATVDNRDGQITLTTWKKRPVRTVTFKGMDIATVENREGQRTLTTRKKRPVRTVTDRDFQLDHGWPESRTSQARSAQRCRMRSFSLHEAFVKQARDSTRQGALRKLVGASWSAQVALRKLHCASCSAQVAPRKLLRQVGPCKWLPASCSVQIALPASCSVQAALCKLLCASCSA